MRRGRFFISYITMAVSIALYIYSTLVFYVLAGVFTFYIIMVLIKNWYEYEKDMVIIRGEDGKFEEKRIKK